jgi:hypothetical protein
MKIEELIVLLNNRLNAFKLARDYAKMSGDLDAMNKADVEITGIEDTLYKLNLLVDASTTAEATDTTVTELIGSVSTDVLALYDITSYATDPLHEAKIAAILEAMGEMKTVEAIDAYIELKYPTSPVTGQMIANAGRVESVDVRLIMAIMEQDSRFGTEGLAVSTLNPGNVGNDDDGNTHAYASWQEGVAAVAEWLSRHRKGPLVPLEVVIPVVATSTPAFASTTPSIFPPPVATSTPPTATTTPPVTTPPVATTTPPFIAPPVATTTPSVVTPPVATSTPPVIDPPVATTTPPIIAPPSTSISSTTPIAVPAAATSSPAQ